MKRFIRVYGSGSGSVRHPDLSCYRETEPGKPVCSVCVSSMAGWLKASFLRRPLWMIKRLWALLTPSSRCFIRNWNALQNSKKWKLCQLLKRYAFVQHIALPSLECYVLDATLIHPAADSRLPKTRRCLATNPLLCTIDHTITPVTYWNKNLVLLLRTSKIRCVLKAIFFFFFRLGPRPLQENFIAKFFFINDFKKVRIVDRSDDLTSTLFARSRIL